MEHGSRWKKRSPRSAIRAGNGTTEPVTDRCGARLALFLASPPWRTYNRPAMTKRKHIDVSVYLFTVLLIGFFARAVWGVLGMIGLVG